MKVIFTQFFFNLLTLFIASVAVLNVDAQTIAFPGAEGAGKFTSGGRGTASVATTVFEVTNLSDVNSAGSLRYACSQSSTTYPYRTIIFRVSGTIRLTSKLNIPKNTTIAGQTAPGDGICIADYPVVISGDNVIVRYIRCRMGDRYQNTGMVDGAGSDDALGNMGGKNIIIDHCSISWSTDEALTVYRGDSLTLQWNIISEPLNYSYHFETGDTNFEHHGYGGIWGSRNGSFHHNLIAHCKNRTPRFAGVSTYTNPMQGAEMCDFRNNVLYNWGINNIYGGEGGYYNIVNNYYKYGPSTTSRKFQVVGIDYSDNYPYAKYYLKGNYVDGSTANTNNNWLSVTMKSGNLADTALSKVTTPFSLPALGSETSATIAYVNVLNGAGASFPKRDTLDERIINDVKNRTGKLIDVQGGYEHGTSYTVSQAAWPQLNSTDAPTDTDHDGMPDTWELSNGLNPNSASDRNNRNSDGYTMLEVYLNSLVAATTSSQSPASATWALTADQLAVATGDVIATAQSMDANMSVKNYATFNAGSANDASFVPYTAQRVLPNGGNTTTPIGWPANQSGNVANQYVQYTISPTNGKVLTVTDVSIDFGPAGSTNVMKANIEYSLDGFVTAGTKLNGPTPLTLPAVASNDNSYLTAFYNNLSISVSSGKTFTLRVYPWWPSTASPSKYLVEKNVVISGTTTAQTMPLKLVSFKASLTNGLTKLVKLNWQTADEANTKNFEIERSGDGKKFVKIGEVSSKNISSVNYSFNDNSPVAGTSYYRLKMNDLDGVYTYSSVEAVRNVINGQVNLYPNPASDKLAVELNMPDTEGNISIISTTGKTVYSQTVSKGALKSIVDISTLPAGVFVLVFDNGEEKYSQKLIKQ